MMVVGGLLLIGRGGVVINVCGVLIVSCLLWLFYEVGVWLMFCWYGYVYTRDKPIKTKRSNC